MKKLLHHISERGLLWTLLFASRVALLGLRSASERGLRHVQKKMVAQEMKHFLIGDATMSARTFTESYNREFYDQYDWSKGGDEWTDDVEQYLGLDPEVWKQKLIDEMLLRYIPKGGEVLEIGPGGGRWTEVLQPLCRTLHIADISTTCLDLCRERFHEATNIHYHPITDGTLSFLDDRSLDAVWSYDVFVHINPTLIDRYLQEFRRVLRPGSFAVIHHAGNYRPEQAEQIVAAGRSPMNRAFLAHLARQRGLEIVEQNDALPHLKGDTITVLREPESGKEVGS